MNINSLSRRRTLVDSVVDQVRNNIESGAIKPGDRLPSEFELCDRFGVSRTVIREATRRLQALGLVEVRRGRGLFVGNQDSVRDTVQVIRSSLSVSLADLAKFTDFRNAIESHAARQAALKATAGDVEKLQDLCDRLTSTVEKDEDLEATQRLDIAFHQHIAKIAGNDLLAQILQLVEDMMRKSIVQSTQGQILDPVAIRLLHQKIVDAIRDRDPLRAEQAMREHMEAVQQRLEECARHDKPADLAKS
ncbi:MAG: FadR family transcriptional regulator [Chthoniobacterales bacterium]|nr:FadR family transcriptional regulator [Chthoniobacterales bacterium]